MLQELEALVAAVNGTNLVRLDKILSACQDAKKFKSAFDETRRIRNRILGDLPSIELCMRGIDK